MQTLAPMFNMSYNKRRKRGGKKYENAYYDWICRGGGATRTLLGEGFTGNRECEEAPEGIITEPNGFEILNCKVESSTGNDAAQPSLIVRGSISAQAERALEMRERVNKTLTSISRLTFHVSQKKRAKRKAAFTLSELLITILIIGIIAAVTIPVVKKAMPDKFEIMRRKCYYTMENTVAQLVTDEIFYQTKRDGRYGLKDTDRVRFEGNIYEGETKFCELYASRMNKRGDSVTNCTADAKTFTATDNVDWYLPVTDFSGGYAPIKFDVNGTNEPNCEYDAQTCPKPDTFTYYILASGKLVEQDPRLTIPTYCIRTEITGSGTVSPSTEYCGLTNGTYTITATPSEHWQSNWAENKKEVVIQDDSKDISVVFTEMPKACITLNVNCETGLPNTCGSYSISGGSFTQDSNQLKVCDLYSNTYTITVTPLSTHTTSWTSENVILNGEDRELTVDLTEKKYCATLDVDCPGGGANICGTYEITGNGKTYGMDASGVIAKTCALKNGSHTLTVTPNGLYEPNTTTKNFTISSSDWSGSVAFTQRKANCKTDGYFEAGGKKWSCPFTTTSVTYAECSEMVANGSGIKRCTSYVDYWAGAVKQCGGVDKLPTMEDLAQIASAIYNGNPSIGAEEDKTGLSYTSGTASSLGLPEPSFSLWSGEETYSSGSVYGRSFGPTTSHRYLYSRGNYSNYDPDRTNSYIQAVCLVE